jgi:hypothetical protein
MEHDKNEGINQQEVDECRTDVNGEKSQQPEDHQN